MNSVLLHMIQKGKIWDFDGGIHPPEMKDQTSHIPLRRLPLADYFILPLQQHIGVEGELLVKTGQHVLKGQPLTCGTGKALPIHAPTSGTIKDIAFYTTAHPSGLSEHAIFLQADGDDRWCERVTYENYTKIPPLELIDKIEQAGIAGLGGAGFPAGLKLNGGLNRVEILIINAAECEPYITADDRLMQEHADEIVEGINILRHILNPTITIIGIEDNKPEAIDAFNQVLTDHPDILLRVVPTKYPSGGARQLTKILTGREVPYGKHSSSIGVLMHNVGTVFAIKRAILHGEPLIERVTTLTGDNIQQPGNVWLPFGTPVQHILKHCGAKLADKQNAVIMGGPLMGFTLPDLNVPIVKITNCILMPSAQEMSLTNQEQNCIRCGKCAEVCPANLLPQQLYWFSRGKEHQKAQDYHLFDCIECGACAYVCPSNIPLVQYYRQEKAEVKEQKRIDLLAQQAKKRFEAKQARVEKEKAERQQRHKQAAANVDKTQKSEIEAALARVKAKQAEKAAAASVSSELTIKSIQGNALPNNQDVIAARALRKEQARQHRCRKMAMNNNAVSAVQNSQLVTPVEPTPQDDRKAAVADAIARAKARKQAMHNNASASATENTAENPVEAKESNSSDTNDRKAAVADAIARAKARKQAMLNKDTSEEDSVAAQPVETAEPANTETDARKAAVAEAIARAKARKQAMQNKTASTENRVVEQPVNETESTHTDADARKAAVAEAIARAKAKKAQREQQNSSSDKAEE